jgi:hypothetical protein
MIGNKYYRRHEDSFSENSFSKNVKGNVAPVHGMKGYRRNRVNSTQME